MIYLRSVDRIKKDKTSAYPYNVEAINNIKSIEFNTPVTFFIGENGCGKTTLLESIVELTQSINLVPDTFQKSRACKQLSESFQLIFNQKTSRGFYLKSQSFIVYIKYLEQMRQETTDALKALEKEFDNRSKYAFELAAGPYNNTLSALTNRYGDGLGKMSHGEGYIELFKSRIVPNGLYLLDEPELSLSPMRQLSLIALIKEMVDKNCQFIIITHSPILMSYKDAMLYEFKDNEMKIVKYGDIEHINITRDFLNNPDQYLRYL